MRATRRVKLVRPFRHEAGYLCARAEWIADAPPCAEGDPHAQLAQLTEHLVLGRELRLAIAGWVEEVQRRGKERQAGRAPPGPRLRPTLALSPSPSPPPQLQPQPRARARALVLPLPRRASCGAC